MVASVGRVSEIEIVKHLQILVGLSCCACGKLVSIAVALASDPPASKVLSVRERYC